MGKGDAMFQRRCFLGAVDDLRGATDLIEASSASATLKSSALLPSPKITESAPVSLSMSASMAASRWSSPLRFLLGLLEEAGAAEEEDEDEDEEDANDDDEEREAGEYRFSS